MTPEEVFSDFDAILDLDSFCKLSINKKVSIVRKVAHACCTQIEFELNELREPLSDLKVHKEIEKKYKFWKNLNNELLKF